MNKTQTIQSFIYDTSKPYLKWYVFLCLAPIFSGISFALNNYAIQVIIDTIIGEVNSYQVFIYPFSVFIIIEICTRFFWSLHDYSEYKLQGNVDIDAFIKPYEYVQNHSYAYFQDNFSGSLVSKLKSIPKGFHNFWDKLSHGLLENISVIIFNVAMVGLLSPYLLLPVAFTIFVFGTLGYFQSKKYDMYSFEIENNSHKLLGMVSDKISNIFTIFSFATRKKEAEEIRDFYQNIQTPAINRLNYYNFLTWVIFGTIYSVTFLAVFMYAIYLRKFGVISTGTLVATVLIVLRSCHEIFCLTNNVLTFIQNLADLRASLDGIFVKQDIIDKPNPVELKVLKGEIIFQNVSFHYANNKTVFQELNLHIAPGQKVGVVGHSGAGKSTLIALLLKNFKACSGDIIIDNQSIYDVSSESLRSQVSLVPQDITLFHRTIGENIGYAKGDATNREIENAAKAANIHELIKSLPEGYNTLVGERGVKLSGGQRQRIAIARAILKNAPILILDEATSSLDSPTEQEIQKSIYTLLDKNNATVIAIAHRLSTIKHLDNLSFA